MNLIRVKIFLRYTLTILFNVFTSYKKLVKRIHMLSGCQLPFIPTFSGRIAINQLASSINNSQRKALIPDYICNVVNIALEKAGYEIFTYKIDNYYEPNIPEISSIIDKERISLLVTASIYGSSAMIDDLLDKSLLNAINKNDTHVLIDLCQDFQLLKSLPKNVDQRLSIAVSFNDKSFFGAMGGGLFTNLKLNEEPTKLSMKKRVSLVKIIIRKLIKGNKFNDKKNFEYSYCKDFPYELINYRPSRLQLMLAIAGIRNFRLINKIKKMQLEKIPGIIRTKHVNTAAYVQLDNDSNIIQLRKTPYAIHGKPDKSLHPEIKVVHNKGFLDG